MAEFLIYNKDHWMDSLSTAEIIERVKDNEHFQAKYNARYQRGDIVEVQPDGHWTNRGTWSEHAFVLVVIWGMSKEETQKYMEAWERNTSAIQILNDSINHIYEYICNLNRTSSFTDELFGENDFLSSHLPPDIIVLNRDSLNISIRFEPFNNPRVKTFGEILALSKEEQKKYITPEQRYEEFQIKEEIIDLKKLLRRRKYQMNMAQISLDAEKKAVLATIDAAYITDKSKVG